MRKHYIYIFLILISFFSIISNVKADFPKIASSTNLLCKGEQCNFYYKSIDPSVTSTEQRFDGKACNYFTEADVNSFKINGKSCEDIKKQDDNQCYNEMTKGKICYASLGPKLKNDKKIVKNDTGTYMFYISMGFTNANSLEQHELKTIAALDKETIKDYTGDENAEIVDVYHLGYLDGFELYNQKDENTDNLNIEDFIYNWGTWSAKPTFFPIDKATLNEDKTVTITGTEKYIANWSNWGINVKYKGDAPEVISTKFYVPIIWKLKLSVKTCTIEQATNADGNYDIYYGKSSNGEQHILNDDSGLNNEKDKIQEKFVEECGCDAANEYWYKGLGETEHYKKYCNNTPTTSNRACDVQVENNECTGKVTIKDNASCIFDKNNINVYVVDDTSKQNKYTTFSNGYCNISCAEDITIELPKKVGATKAGTYYTWSFDSNKISATGKRTCRATVDMSKLKNKVTNTLNDSSYNAKDVISDILKIESNKVTYTHSDKYSYKQENEALKKLYDSISDNYDSTSNTSCACDGLSRCPIKHSFEVSIDLLNKMKFTNNGYCNNESTIGIKELKNRNISLGDIKTAVKNALKTSSDSIITELEEINKCSNNFDTTKESTYDFSPELEFSYNEPYKTLFSEKKYQKTKTTEDDSGMNVSFDTKSLSYYNGEKDKQMTYNYINDGYINSVVTKTIEKYSSPLTFYSVIPTGETVVLNGSNFINYAKTVVSTNSKFTNKLSSDEYDVYPIALSSSKKDDNALDKYSFKITNLGDYDITGSNSNIGRMDSLIKEKNTYYCTYEIENDVTTPDKPNFYYRNISLNNINPNNRNLGKNWSKDNEKAKATLCEIAGGKYNNGDCTSQANTSPESTYEKPEYSFTLTPENMQEIKKYNLEKEKDSNGYANFDMTKIDASTKDQNGNTLSEGVWFKSNFIWDTNTCQNCFTNKTNEKETTFSKWSDSAKLSGPGPAWK